MTVAFSYPACFFIEAMTHVHDTFKEGGTHMGLFDLFGKKISLDEMGKFNKQVLTDALELVINSGIGDQYKELFKSVKEGSLKKAQLKECQAFVKWYEDLVASQPNLKASFGEANYKATIKALQDIGSFVARKLG